MLHVVMLQKKKWKLCLTPCNNVQTFGKFLNEISYIITFGPNS